MIYPGPLTRLQQERSQRNYNIFNVINGLSYMCLGETVLILFAVQLLCLLAASIAAIVYTLFEMYSGECRGIMILGGAIPALSFLAEWSFEAALKKRKNEEEK